MAQNLTFRKYTLPFNWTVGVYQILDERHEMRGGSNGKPPKIYSLSMHPARLRFSPSSVVLLLALSVAAPGRGEVRLPKIFSSHAVLQRGQPIHVWGWSNPGERVSATLDNGSQNAIADSIGNWSVYFPPHPAGGPFQLAVSATNRIVLDDILIGDVWFASGQSNMEMPLMGFPGSAVVSHGAEEIQNANQPNLRLLFIPHKAASYPLADFQGDVAWTICSPETAAKFSAVAYFFGREIVQREHVAVGLIDSTWGGTPAEAWTSLDGLSADASLMPVFASWAAMANEQTGMQTRIETEKREDEAARQAHAPLPKHSWHPSPESWDPSWLYNGMVSPAVAFGIKGVIWYQGESNSSPDRASVYYQVFSTLIKDWRRHWHQGDFPFLFTQISSFKAGSGDGWPVVRDAQRRALSLVNTGMAVTIDVGDPDNVHPADKQTVGGRLALAARAIAYHETLEFSGPSFRQASTEAGAVRVWFDHAEGGLKVTGEGVRGFEIAGEDHRFVPATARIEGSSVLASNPQVPMPKYVRYGWQNVSIGNIFNNAGLPASPFVSD